MGIEIQGRVGPVGIPSSLGDGVLTDPFLGPQSQLMVQDWAPRYAEMARRGVLFNASNQTGTALTALASTQTGFALINPLGSGKNLAVCEIAVAQTSTAAAAANAAVLLGACITPLALSTYTLTTPLTINNALIGGQASSVARVIAGGTLGSTPVAVRAIWQPSVSATATTSIPPFIKDEVAGAVVVAPGCSVVVVALSALSAVVSMTWAELPA